MLCEYGCGQEAKYQIGKNEKWCCSSSYNQCPVKRKQSSKGRKYRPKKINDGRICGYGCGEYAHYEHKNGAVSCNKIIQKCKGNRERTRITKLNGEGPKKYYGDELCSYGCGQRAYYIFGNGNKCCSKNIGECVEILNRKWDNMEIKYGVRNPMLIEEAKKRQNLARDKTIFDRYGVVNPIHIDGMKEKLELIFLERFGVKSPLELANKKAVEQNRWLDTLGIREREVRIDLNDGIGGEWIKVDGFDPETNTIYEFWGDMWHGNLKILDFNDCNPYNGKTMGELNEETKVKIDRILKAGYNLIDIWENDWLKQKEGDRNDEENAT